MNFLNGWTINIEKLPKYSAFSTGYDVSVPVDFLQFLYNSENRDFTDERKTLLKNVIDACSKNKLKVKHCNRYGLGRFYPNQSISLISLSRHFKHTIFTFMNWIDLDMVKGHPTILYEIAKQNGIELKAFKKYLDDPISIFDELVRHYSSSEYEIKSDDEAISHSNVKDIFNIYIYGGCHSTWLEQMVKEEVIISNENEHPFVKEFKNDCNTIKELVFLNNSKIANLLKKEGENYEDAKIINKLKRSVMSYFCGTIENHIIFLCYKFLQKEGIILKGEWLPEYDGLCLKYPEKMEENELQGIVKRLNNHILDKLKLNIKMIWKNYQPKYVHSDLIEEFHLKKQQEVKVIEQYEDEFTKISQEFEENHCKITNKSFFIKQTTTDNIVLSKQQIITSYEHMVYHSIDENGNVKKNNFINDWLKNNPNQKKYDDIGVYPNINDCPNNVFNMWRPFAMEYITEYEPKPDELQIIRNHIKVLCGNDENVTEYFEKWIAQMIQYPSIKSICPTLISKEGAGKGTLMKLFCKMLSDAKVYETTNPSRDIWGDFNGRMANTFLINLNELSKKETIEAEGRIKGLITDPKLTINNKGSNQYDIQSYHRFIITTNKEEPINTSKQDRRNLIIRSSDEKCNDREYFKMLHQILEDVNVIKTCYEYFKSIPNMDTFNLLPIPVTEYQTDLKELSANPIEKWIESLTFKNIEKNTVELTTEEIYDLFSDWCNSNGIEYKCNGLQLMVRIARLKINGIEKHKTKTCTKTLFDINMLKSHFAKCLIA